MPPRFAIIGAGKMGTALARLLSQAGYGFIGAASRSLDSARRACELVGAGEPTTDAPALTRSAGLVLLTVPDDAIARVCRELAAASAFGEGAVVAHCSGAYDSTVLAPARACGASVGSMHPLQTLATVEQAMQALPGSFCCVEGDPHAASVLSDVARAFGGRVMSIPTEGKPLYHAAAVTACNFLVALVEAALKLDEAAGIGRAEALQSLMPLVRATVDNIERVGIPQCLTGPIARGDVETTGRHLRAIGQAAPDLLPLYRALGLQTVEVALAKGTLPRERAAELREMLGQ